MYSPTVHHYFFPRRTRRWPLIAVVLGLTLVILYALNIPQAMPGIDNVVQMSQVELPLSFVPNKGQTVAEVQYQVADMGGTLFFTNNKIVFTLPTVDQAPTVTQLQFLGANPEPVISGQTQLPGTVNYILGDDPTQWATDLPTYQSIVYQELYPGIDLSYDGTNGRLKGTYTVAPGANPSLIQWQHEGATAVSLDVAHNLHISLPGAAEAMLVEKAPVAWQEIYGQRQMVTAAYVIAANNTVGFSLGSYNNAYPLIIDPTLIYSTTLGGSSFEVVEGIALDSEGIIYITGTTSSVDFPTANPYEADDAYTDIFVAKINAAGDSLIYSTYIGGGGDDEASSIAVDSNGLAYLTGSSDSSDFPVINALQDSKGGLDDAVILKLKASGNVLLISTYLGGSSVESGEGLALDADNNIYVTGLTASANFPTAAAWDSSLGGTTDAFVTKMNSAGDAWVYSSYLGGSDVDFGSDIALDEAGNAYILGNTFSTNFSIANAFQNSISGNGDMFVTKFNAAGDGLVYSTYLGGSEADYGYAIAVQDGLATVTGHTASTDFPLETAVQNTHGGGTSDALLTQLSADGQSLLFSTYMGGSGEDKGYDVVADNSGSIYLTGDTFSTNFPTATPLQANLAGGADAFVAKLDNQLLSYSTYLGGSDSDHGYGIATDEAGHAYVVGVTISANFPSGSPLANSPGGETDVFIMKISDDGNGSLPPVAGSNLAGSAKEASQLMLGPDEKLTFTIRLHNSGTEDITVEVSDALPDEMVYVDGSAKEGGIYDSGAHTLAWEGVSVASGAERLLTFAVTVEVAEPTVVVNTAVITPANQDPIERSTAVLLTPETIVDKDIIPPYLTKVAIDTQDVLTDRAVTLHVEASDDVDVEQMYVVEWQLATQPYPHWQEVQASGWVPFQTEMPWMLGEASGTHYVAVWVADAAENVSPLTLQAVDYASLLLPGDTVDRHDSVAYLVHYEADEVVTATLTPLSGDADLYVWYPGNFLMPDQKSSNEGTAVDTFTFTAPTSGPYLFLVYGYSEATYALAIAPGGGVTASERLSNSNRIASLASVSDKETLTAEPTLSLSGLNPLGIASTPDGPFTLYLPILFSG